MANDQRAGGFVYVLTEGWPGDDQIDVGVFTSLLEAQQAADPKLLWEENKDVIRSHTFRMWEGYDSANEVNVPAWIYEYEVNRAYR